MKFSFYCYNCGQKWKATDKAYAWLKEQERINLPYGPGILIFLDTVLHCCDHPQIFYKVGTLCPPKIKPGKYKTITLKDLIKERL